MSMKGLINRLVRSPDLAALEFASGGTSKIRCTYRVYNLLNIAKIKSQDQREVLMQVLYQMCREMTILELIALYADK